MGGAGGGTQAKVAGMVHENDKNPNIFGTMGRGCLFHFDIILTSELPSSQRHPACAGRNRREGNYRMNYGTYDAFFEMETADQSLPGSREQIWKKRSREQHGLGCWGSQVWWRGFQSALEVHRAASSTDGERPSRAP